MPRMPLHRDGDLPAADGVRLHWREWRPDGEPDARVVLIHGGAEHGARYPALVERLVGAGLAVRAPDLRGHGRSGGRRGSVGRFEDYISDLDRLVAPGDDRPLFLVGYSLGGLVALTYAAERPGAVAGVVAAGPALGVGEKAPGIVFAAARAVGAVAPRLRLFRLAPDTMMSDPAAVRAYRADPLVFHGRFDARLLGELVTAMERAPGRLARLRAPLLIVHGAGDTTADPRASARAVASAGVSDATLRLYDGLRHDLFNEPGGDAVCADVAGWIQSRCPVRSPS